MMETQRLIILMVFLFSSFLLWDAWQRYNAPKKPTPQAEATPGAVPVPTASTPGPAPSKPDVPSAAPQRGERIKLSSEALSLELDTMGGDIRKLALNRHAENLGAASGFPLMSDSGTPYYVTQSGLLGEGMPNHNTVYAVESSSAAPTTGGDASVRLAAQNQSGARVHKTFRLKAQSPQSNPYLIEVSFEVENLGSEPISPHAYFQLVRDGSAGPGDTRFVTTFTGPAVYTEQAKFSKITFPDIDKGKQSHPKTSSDGWIGLVQHYFVAAWLPVGNIGREFFTRKVDDKLYAAGVIVPLGRIEPGKKATVTVPLYAGPQETENLKRLAPGLDLTVDYGWLTFLAFPLFWVLQKIHAFVGNWGTAIILLTVLIKLAFYPLSAASYRSMARMKVVAPKIQRLREQYGDDRQKMSQAMMDLYKTEKINPLGGCLPIVVQIPVFIALYWVLLNAVELRHAPFALWIKDLSAPDPYYVLPVIMGLSMIVQTKLNPPPPDPVQAKVMTIMPIVFSVFFFFFAAGLVLYWTVNNILSIAQQWQITRAAEAAAAKAGDKR